MILLILALPPLFAAEGRKPIAAAMNISEPGSYIVTHDIETTGGAINIGADNVTIDLDGHTIASTGGTVFHADGTTNIKIMNGQVSAYYLGVWFDTPGGNFAVEDLDITVTGTAGYGIVVWGTAASPAYAVIRRNVITRTTGSVNSGIYYEYCRGNIEDNKVTNFEYGIELSYATNTFVQNNYCGGNAYGIGLSDSDYVIVKGNTVSDNTDTGLTLDTTSEYNTVKYNSASGNATYGIYVGSNFNNLDHNTTACGAGTGLYVWGCGNIYSNNKAPGLCSFFDQTGCGPNPNVDGGGNTF